MKTTNIFMILFLALFAFAISPAFAVDAPHNASVAITCADCHSQFTTGSYTDDVCLSCHLNATGGGYTKNSAPKMLTHASANTSDKYGNWSYTCVSCHNNHMQDQVQVSGPAGYLITGLITSVSDNGDGTSTFGYANLVENYAGWSDYTRWGRKSVGNASSGNERGLILFANTSNPDVSFEILSATATSMSVKGSLNDAFPGTVTAGSPFAIAYGQLMNAGVVSAGSMTRTVNFFQNSSVKSFAHADAPGSPDSSPDGMCQVCHTRTSFWRYDGSLTNHYSGTNCTTCHKHEAGFKTSCDVCHNAPPSTGTHETHVGTATPKYYESTAVQSTSSAYGYSCGICHKGTHLNTAADPRTVETVFSGVATQDPNTQTGGTAAYTASSYTTDNPGKGYTFNYSDGTCSNTYCHGNYPGSGTKAAVNWTTGSAPCGSCHGASNTTYPNSGTHFLHAATYVYNYSCTLCHKDVVAGTGPDAYTIADKSKHVNGFVDWMFDISDPRVSASSVYSIPSGSAVPSNGSNPRIYGTCSNVYCHSIVQTSTGGPLTGAPGEYQTTSRWDRSTSTANCGSCHKNGSHHIGYPGTMDSGSHTTHLNYAFNIPADGFAGSFKCAICHRYESQQKGAYTSCPACHSTGAVYKGHADGKVNVNIDTVFGTAIYNDTSPIPGTPGDGFYSCSNTYCHSNGTSVATLNVPSNISPVWGSGTASCNSCHGSPPSYPSGSPKANSHVGHAGETCNACHINTTTNGSTIANKTVHVNKQYDVFPDAASGITFTYTFASSGGSCLNISCHGGGTATWGVALTCQNCHLSTADADDFSGFFYNNGASSKIKGAGEWDSTGHGRPAASGPYASGNAAAGFTTANACQYCHDSAVTHKTASNPFRLRTITDATWGMNGVCQNCHADRSAGVAVDSVIKNGAKKVGSYHYGAKHNAGANGGQFCWDCHDPHGDGNIFMIHGSVAKTSDMVTGAPLSAITTSFISVATGTSYAKSTSPFNGVCNVCHSNTNHYTATSGDGHNAASRCTSCHTHTGDTAGNAFRGACNLCHGNPPVNNATLVGSVYPSSTGSTTAGAHQSHVTNLQITCDSCHAGSAGTGATHNNGDLNVTLGFSLFSGSYVGGAYNGQTAVHYNASSPSTTVSSGGLKECSNIYCHGSTMAPNGGTDTSPVWDKSATAACGTCHGATTDNPPTRGAHFRHSGPVTDVGHANSCSMCHKDPSVDPSLHVNNKSEVIFSADPKVAGASYSGTTAMLDVYGNCSNVYCHSNVQTSPPGGALTYKTVNWSDRFAGDPACNACHQGPADHYSVPLTGNTTGSHAKHAAYTIYCATCHANNINDDPSPNSAGWGCTVCHTATGPNDKHADRSVDVKIVTIYGGTYSGTPAPGDAYGNCSATYCHSTGASVRTGSVSANASALWGSGTLSCNACHGNNTYALPNNAMPAYTNGSPKENSHLEHVINNSMACANCHAGTTTTGTTIANPSLHVNKRYDMQSSGAYAGRTISFTYSAATATTAGSCSSISCHGGNVATWGGRLTCASCHAGAADTDDYTFGNGAFALVSTGQWTTTGHGRSAASGPYVSGNAAADFTIVNACQYCHDNTIQHNNALNPFRLRGITNPAWGLNGVCQNCHAEGSAGITIDSVLRNGAKKVGVVHYGAKHSALANGGQFCWDCHDAHGDSNAYMVHGAVAKTSDLATGVPTSQIVTVFTGTDFAKSAAPFNGICNVCHTTTSHYTASSGDGHNAGINCSQCHNHTDGFKPSGDSCSDCHSAAGGAMPGTTPDAYHAKHVQTAYVGRISSGDYGNYTTNQWYRYSNTGGMPDTGCGYCHPQSAATHMNGVVNLNFDPNDAGAQGTLKAKNNPAQNYTQSQRVSVTCSSVYCHSNGYRNGALYGYVATPNWYNGSFAGDRCANCHGNSPTGSTAHAAHAVGIHYTNIFTGTTGTAAAGNTNTSSHGYADVNGTELTSTTISCNICHNSTVTTAANDKNTLCATCHTGSNLKGVMAIAASSTTHVNGLVEVVFTSTPIRSKAQVRDSIANVAELNNTWTRMNGYKGAGSYDVAKTAPSYTSGNCTVACHNSKPVSWSSTVTCNSCHTDLP